MEWNGRFGIWAGVFNMTQSSILNSDKLGNVSPYSVVGRIKLEAYWKQTASAAGAYNDIINAVILTLFDSNRTTMKVVKWELLSEESFIRN